MSRQQPLSLAVAMRTNRMTEFVAQYEDTRGDPKVFERITSAPLTRSRKSPEKLPENLVGDVPDFVELGVMSVAGW